MSDSGEPSAIKRCDVHDSRLVEMEIRLSRIEDDLEAIAQEQQRNATSTALAAQAVDILKTMITRLEGRFDGMETRVSYQMEQLKVQIETITKGRWQVIAGLLANGAIGAASLATTIWLVDKFLEYSAR